MSSERRAVPRLYAGGATWTQLLGEDGDATVPVDAAHLRELLLDLVGHPGVAQVQRLTLTLRDGRRVALSLGDRPALQAGASGPIIAGAALQTRDVAPLAYTPDREPSGGPLVVEVDAWAASLRQSAGELRQAVDDAVNGRVQSAGKVILP